jgi:cell division septation protein DedD
MRTEATVSRNTDLLTQLLLPRESFSFGFNGHVMARTSIGVDLYLDRATNPSTDGSPWATRSIVRLTQTMTTGSAYVPGSGPFRSVPARALATVRGTVFTDWNGNGQRDAGEEPVENVPLRIGSIAAAHTAKNGEFIFQNVPDGLHDVGLDLGALPIDFDAPPIPRVHVSLSGRDTRQVAFGLIPLGAIRGRVVRDLNGNGQLDRDEPAMDGAVVVLDSGKRSERLKRGAFAFEAVPSGEHTVTLLSESLPDGAQIAGDATQIARLERDRMTVDVAFLVSLSARAEIRKVFAGGSLPSSSPARVMMKKATTPESPSPQRRFSLQVAAFDDPERARHMVATLSSKGLDAYLVEPPISNPNAPYRVRIGRYDTRDDAERAAVEMRKSAGTLWITEGGK